MTRVLPLASIVCCALSFAAGAAQAQAIQQPVGRLQVGIGAGWLGGASLGDQPADLRTSVSGPYRLFESETDFASTVSFDARAGFGLSRRIAVEGRAMMSSPELRTVVSSDAEATGTFTIGESVKRYVFDGGVVVRLDELATMGLLPFVTAGGGYVRQLHGENDLVESGTLYYVGGGVTRVLATRSSGLIRAVGVRTDLRLDIVSLELDESSLRQGSVSGSLTLTF